VLQVTLVATYHCYSSVFSSSALSKGARVRSDGLSGSSSLLSRASSSQFLFLHCSSSTALQKALSLCHLGNRITGRQFLTPISKYSADQRMKLLPQQKASHGTHGLRFQMEAGECFLSKLPKVSNNSCQNTFQNKAITQRKSIPLVESLFWLCIGFWRGASFDLLLHMVPAYLQKKQPWKDQRGIK